jgi:hypothetical protein
MSSARGKIALAGGILITTSGLVSTWIGARAGYLVYEPDPSGVFGHVGILAGIAAVTIGSVLVWVARREPAGPAAGVAVGLVTVVIGHLGAIAGALLVGTSGMVLCYVAGVWALVKGIRQWGRGS